MHTTMKSNETKESKKFYQKNPYLIVYSLLYIVPCALFSLFGLTYFILGLTKIVDTNAGFACLAILPLSFYYIYHIIDYDRAYYLIIDSSKISTPGDLFSDENDKFQHKCEILFSDIVSIKIIKTDGCTDDLNNKKSHSELFHFTGYVNYGGCLYRYFEIETADETTKRIKLFYFSNKQISTILNEILNGIKNSYDTVYDGKTHKQIFTQDLYEKNSLFPYRFKKTSMR